jgi:hypothetical protein
MMFPQSFLFGSALLALPLVGLPVLLHLLFRRKSPVMLFSTIRFIKASVQRTAARKRVQRWTLLACRALALLLLILVAAQPAKMLVSGWSRTGRSLNAAVIIDTSYSMLLKDQQITLLARADGMAQDLLRGQLKTGKAAIFTSQSPPVDSPVRLVPAAEVLSQWSPLHPQPNPMPLTDRVAAAIELLKQQPADDKWLIVISDFQKKEFPRQLAAFPEAHVVLMDLHPESPDSAGITGVALDPPQPTAGIGADVMVSVTGTPKRPRPVSVSVEAYDGAKLLETPMQMAGLDGSGHARLRFPVRLPSRQWLIVRAAFSDDDDMTWDNSRQLLVEMPPRQIVSVLSNPSEPTAARFVTLALDPMSGKTQAWPLLCRQNADITPDTNVAVMLPDTWPDAARLASLQKFVRKGGTLIWFLRPGIEQSWLTLPPEVRTQLEELLPSDPLAAETSDVALNTLGVASLQDPLLSGFADKRFGLDTISVLRFVPFAPGQGPVTQLLTAFPADPKPGTHPHGFLYRRLAGQGTVYTFATLPDPQYTNLPTHPLFLPLLVRMALRQPGESDARNIEIGRPIVLSGKAIEGVGNELRITDPQGAESAVTPSTLPDGTIAFVYPSGGLPGIYRWHKPNSDAPIELANVQLPASESDLVYAHPDDVMDSGDSVVVAHSVQDLQTHVGEISQPEPHWSPMVAALLMLLCVEAFLASTSKLSKTPFTGRGSSAAHRREVAARR